MGAMHYIASGSRRHSYATALTANISDLSGAKNVITEKMIMQPKILSQLSDWDIFLDYAIYDKKKTRLFDIPNSILRIPSINIHEGGSRPLSVSPPLNYVQSLKRKYIAISRLYW